MKIIEFNTNKGIYNFELDEINTKFHAHPAIEIIHALNGKFFLETLDNKYPNLSFAIIDKNISHKIISDNCDIKMLMIECDPNSFQGFLHPFEIELTSGIFTIEQQNKNPPLLSSIISAYKNIPIGKTKNQRVEKCLDYLDSSRSDYKKMIQELKTIVNLSESRLSHIFKEEMGISIKKYFVWSKLKRAFQSVLNNKINLYEAAIDSGFYDQAHLSNAFKQMLGISPSEKYNSRIIQD